jgi:hypothetical protein
MKLLLTTIALTAASGSAAAWQTSIAKDDFSGKATTVHTAVSKNSLRLEFPYQGKNHGRVYILQRDPQTASVYISLDKGQINCPIDYCAVAVKVGDAEPRNFVVNPMGGGNNSEVSFSYPPALLDELQGAKSFRVRLEVYANGYQTLDFAGVKPLPVDLTTLRR